METNKDKERVEEYLCDLELEELVRKVSKPQTISEEIGRFQYLKIEFLFKEGHHRQS